MNKNFENDSNCEDSVSKTVKLTKESALVFRHIVESFSPGKVYKPENEAK